MNEEEYIELQMGGDIIKPISYHIGEWKALNYFSKNWSINDTILDVGCGIGYGLGIMKLLGFHDMIGIDINPNKVTVGKRLGYYVHNVNLTSAFYPDNVYDVIWCSHAFEHMQDANKAIEKLKDITKEKSILCFVLPYPDLDPAPAHTASKELGLNVEDGGETVINWFTERGLFLRSMRFDNFRENEIWLEFEK